MSPLKRDTNGDILDTNGDILDTNGDIAMSPDPSVEQSVEQSLSAPARGNGFKRERSLTLAKRSRSTTNGQKKPKPPERRPLPEDFKVRVDGETALFLRAECPRLNLSTVLKIFIDSRRSSGAESCDWEADFRKFCLIYQENQDRTEQRFQERAG